MPASHGLVAVAPFSPASFITDVEALLAMHSLAVLDVRHLPVPRSLTVTRSACVWLIESVPDDAGLAADVAQLSDALGVDLVLQTLAARQRDYRLAVFDMDSTLIQCEVIDRLAAIAGVGDAVAAITERAMRGELDFSGSFRERLGMLAGLEERAVSEVAETLPITEGMPELVTTLRARGLRTVILSGGFDVFAATLARRFGFDEYHANSLEIINGAVTGRVSGDIVDGEFKLRRMLAIAETMGVGPDQVIAVGDGANDLPMLSRAGLGVAFQAKPLVRQRAAFSIQHVGLDGIAYLMGSPSESDP